jgi:hypothetical protein
VNFLSSDDDQLALMLHDLRRVAVRCLSSRPYNPWSILGVDPGDSAEKCKAAFRRLALQHHPDVSQDRSNVQDTGHFAAIVAAYECIVNGEIHARPRGLRGVRTVGGVLVVSIDDLKQDPDCIVHAVRLKLTDAPGETRDETKSEAPAAGNPATGVSVEPLHETTASLFDSVADLRMQLQDELDLPNGSRHRHQQRGEGRYELIHRGQLLGEHLFLSDYGLADGNIMYLACLREGEG